MDEIGKVRCREKIEIDVVIGVKVSLVTILCWSIFLLLVCLVDMFNRVSKKTTFLKSIGGQG